MHTMTHQQHETAGTRHPGPRWQALFEMAAAVPPEDAVGCVPPDDAACGTAYERALERDASEEAAAAVVSAFLVIWESGRGFERTAPWLERARALIDAPRPPSALARAALAFHAFTARWMAAPDTAALMAMLPDLRATVDASGSDALRILAAASEAYVLLMRGETHSAQECVRDAHYFAPDPQEALLPKLHLAATDALVQGYGGHPREAVAMLQALLARPDADQWSLHLRLTLFGHHLMCLAEAGRFDEASAASERLRALAIPGNRAYHRSYLHYALGAGALLAGRPADALAHARAAQDIGRLSGSVIARLMPALLQAQALGDLGRDGEALACLEAHLAAWHEHGLLLYLAAAQCERARLLMRQGLTDAARRAWMDARQVIPPGEPLPCLHRRRADMEALVQRMALLPVEAAPVSPEIRIRTLGGFEVRLNDQRLDDKVWKGSRGKTLLKLIIAMGGVDVPADRLADALWPDADGAQARANLKVAVWRLRKHMDEAVSTKSVEWLVQHRGMVSLDLTRCEVDAITFLRAAEPAPVSWEACSRPLGLWMGDFLRGDGDDLPAVTSYREKLTGAYARLACEAARMAVPGTEQVDRTLGWLAIAVSMLPTDERVYEATMALMLRDGRPGAAITLYGQAQARMAARLGIHQPGPRLRALIQQALSET